MPQGNPHLNNLATRKQLLIVESELNRRVLLEDGRVLTREFHSWREQAAHLQDLVSLGVAVFSALQSRETAPSPEKRSWIAPIMDTLRLGASLWTTFRDGKGRD
jgi:hypothetical protein